MKTTLPTPTATRQPEGAVGIACSDLLGFPPVLDACCGSRMFWYDKKDSRAMFVDKRREIHVCPPIETHPKGYTITVAPDTQADFTALPFPDETFYHVIFDPDVYPLNTACLDGRISEELQAHEHPLESAPEDPAQNDNDSP